jgi:hypothetical protein
MNTSSQLALAIALGIAAQQAGAAGFIDDSKATLSLKNVDLSNDARESQGKVGNSAYTGQVHNWGQAFVLKVQSGYTQGAVGFGLDALGTYGVRLDGGGKVGKAGEDRTPGNLFPTDGGHDADQFGRLGLTGKVRFAKTELKTGTLVPNLPILVPNDGRLLPQTFEGTQFTSKDIDHLTFTGGLIEHAVGRASSNSTGLAVSGGTQQSNKFWFGGGDYAITKALTAQYYYANLEDYYTQHFAGLTHIWAIDQSQSFKTDLRFFHTGSDGANGSAAGRAEGYKVSGYARTPGEIQNNTWSASFTYALGGHTFMAGHQRVSEGSNFVQLNQGSLVNEGAGGGSTYLITDRLISNFARAGENTSFAQYIYDFAGLGLPGLKFSTIYLNGQNIKATAGGDQNEWERDLALDYVVQGGTFKGVGIGVRNGSFRTNATGASDIDHNRLILTYQLALF